MLKDNPTKNNYLLTIIKLFWTFLKIGIISFGGGYAMIAIIEREIVDKKQWLNSQEMLNILAIAETTPGPISINTSTYVGYRKGGFLGALVSTLGVVLPSFVIIFIISFFVNIFANPWVSYALKGMRIGALVLILNAVLKMFKKQEKTLFGIIILIATFVVTLLTNFSIIYTLLCCAVLGIVYNFLVRLVKYIKEVNL